MSRQRADEPVNAVILLWDADSQGEERRDGVIAARDEARASARFDFDILCGFPDPEREAWILAGFDPSDDEERRALDELVRELSFSPVHDAPRLRDKAPGALRNIKRVLAMLIRDDLDREARCWSEPPLPTLRERWRSSGLADFLDELEAVLPRLCGAAPPRT